MAEIFSLTLALPPVIEQLLKVGRNLASRVDALQNPRSKLGDLSSFREQDARLLAQFQVGQQICNDPNVDVDIKDSLAKDFVDIQKAMLDAIDCVDRVDRSSKMHRFWIMDKPRRALQESIRRLETAIVHFQDTTRLVYMSASLPSQVLLQSDAFQTTTAMESVEIAEGVAMRHGHLARALGRTQPKTGWFICERRSYVEATKKPIEKDIRLLCELLSSAAASRSVLDILGYRDLPDLHQFELVFDLPPHLQFVSSLRTFIQTHDAIPLNSRLGLSSQLAEAILLVHRLKLVHKNVSSATAVVFTDSRSADQARPGWEVFLVDWHLVRRASAATQLRGQPRWWHGVYQHPTRQLALAEREYTMAHDIYSLGVCMLELLLWASLVLETSGAPARPSDLFRAEALHLQLVSETDWSEAVRRATEDGALLGPRETQKALVSLATRKLPAAAGDRLAQLVVSCLTVLEGGFGDEEIIRSDEVETGLNFVAAVKDTLMQVCI